MASAALTSPPSQSDGVWMFQARSSIISALVFVFLASGSVARLGADLCALFFLCHKRLVINMFLLFCVFAVRRLKLLHTV